MSKRQKANEDIEIINQSLQRNEKGGIKQSLANCVTVFEKDPLLGGNIKRNMLTGQVDIVSKMPWERRSILLTDTDFNNICLYLERYYSLVKDTQIKKSLDIVSSNNEYHPIKEYLENLQWDGTERIKDLLPRYLGAEKSDYVYAATKLMMLGAINRIYYPGCKFEYMVCVAGNQGTGKSTFFRFLAIKDEWFSDDLRRIDDDNVYRKLQGHWFVEMAEMLATSNARSIEEIKSFISRQKETYKIPYETHPEDRPRQCIFVGTSNSMSFLPFDRTGNRRFIPIMTDETLAKQHPLDDEKECREFIINCWAEAMHIFKSGEYKLTLPKDLEEKVKELQKTFTPEDTKLGIIEEWLSSCKCEYVCSRMIYDRVFMKSSIEPSAKELKEISSIMNNSVEGWEPVSSHRFDYYGIQRAWRRIKSNERTEDIWSKPKYDEGGFVIITDEMRAEMPFN